MYISALLPHFIFPYVYGLSSSLCFNNFQKFLCFSCEKYLRLICMIVCINFMPIWEDVNAEKNCYSYKVVLSLFFPVKILYLWTKCEIGTHPSYSEHLTI